MFTRRRFLIGTTVVLAMPAAASAAVWPGFKRTVEFHRQRVSHGSQVITSPFGDIEYAVAGEGAPVLMLHGSGGGFDQAIDSSGPLHAGGFKVIATSRFGYLRTANPVAASPEMQADAYVHLLDHLKIERVPALGFSAGAVSAIHFAARHPKRCSALILVVPAVTAAEPEMAGKGPAPQVGPLARALVEYAVKSDFLFWLGCRFAPQQIYGSVLATNPNLIATSKPDEQKRAEQLMWNILPISARAEGIANDVKFTSTPLQVDLKAISAPTLTISLEDDLYGTVAAARHIAAKVTGARSVIYPSGGHIFIGHEADAFGEISTFLRSHAQS